MSDSGNYNFIKDFSGIVQSLTTLSDALNKAYIWYQQNAETISKYILAFADFGIWCNAVDKLIKNQFVFTDNLTSELANEIHDGADVNEVVGRYYFENDELRMKKLIDRCRQSKQKKEYSELYTQIICAYNMQHYLLACIGLFSLVDGVLSDESGLIDCTNFKKRLDTIEKKLNEKVELSEIDRKYICIHKAFKEFDQSVFKNSSSFSKNEPTGTNRHWDLHGRTRRDHTKIDFLKILLWLDAIIYYSEKDEQQGG